MSFDSKTRSKFRNNAGWARAKGASLGYSEIKSIIISLKLFLRFCLVFKSVPSYPLNTDFNVLKKTFENFFCPLKPFLYGCRLKWRIKNFFWGGGEKKEKKKDFYNSANFVSDKVSFLKIKFFFSSLIEPKGIIYAECSPPLSYTPPHISFIFENLFK